MADKNWNEDPKQMPKKRRSDWNYWQPKSSKTVKTEREQTLAINVSDLKIGTYFGKKIGARVVYISKPRKVTTGSVMSFNIMDKSGEICVTMFGQTVDDYKDFIKLNMKIWIENFSIKGGSKPHYTGIDKDIQLQLFKTSKISICDEDIPSMVFDFKNIEEIKEGNADKKVDLLGILVKVWDIVELVTKESGKRLVKRELTLTDKSKQNIVLTLWGDDATEFCEPEFSVVAVRNAAINTFEEIVSLNAGFGCTVWVHPEIDGIDELLEWFLEEQEKLQEELNANDEPEVPGEEEDVVKQEKLQEELASNNESEVLVEGKDITTEM